MSTPVSESLLMSRPLDLPAVFPDFKSAARGVLDFLRHRLGFDLWMVTRTEGENWIVLDVEQTGYGVKPGMVFNWADTFCSRMVQDLGPRVAPDSTRVSVYAHAPIARLVPIGAYVGVPIVQANGDLFGTLCAIDPSPQPAAVAAEQPLVELCAALLGGLLVADLKAAEAKRRAERFAAETFRDELTGLYTRRAWEDLILTEQDRCRRFGHPAFVAAVAPTVHTPKALYDTARAVVAAARDTDILAVVGPYELAVLGVEGDQAVAERFERQLRQWLGTIKVTAKVGIAQRTPEREVEGAWADARLRLGAL